MENFLKILVEHDKPEAWAQIKRLMPWELADEKTQTFTTLKFEPLDEIDVEDEGEVLQLIASSIEGTIWGEFEIEPYIELGDGFIPYIVTCKEVVLLSKEATPGWSLSGLYKTQTPSKEHAISAVSFLAISCPRCQLIFTQGDEDVEFMPDDGGWVNEDCIACEGSGEWSYELF